jgi:hypothetical protein
MMHPIDAGRAMAQSLLECRAEGILTEEEFQTTVAKCRTIEGNGATPEEDAIELLIVTAFIAEYDRLTA